MMPHVDPWLLIIHLCVVSRFEPRVRRWWTQVSWHWELHYTALGLWRRPRLQRRFRWTWLP